jgi:hypothetical protein
LNALSARKPQRQGKLTETVTYAGALVVHNGACFQAANDTAQVAGGSDWLPIAKAGRDGRSIVLRGEYDPNDAYAGLDVVTRAGSCWIATRDDPGVLGESDRWLLVAAHGGRGERGAPGLRGHCGDGGPSGAKIHSWQTDRESYRASQLMEDGTVGPMLELRPLSSSTKSRPTDGSARAAPACLFAAIVTLKPGRGVISRTGRQV